MSLNMLHGFPRFERLPERLDFLADEIARLDPDIVCLQEVPWTLHIGNAAQFLSNHTGLNYAYLRANGNRRAIFFEEGVAILSRYPLRDTTFAELQPQAGFFEHRVVLGTTAETPRGGVRVYVTHLTNGDPEINRSQAESLMSFVASRDDDLAILAGDFNATDDSPQIETITQRAVDIYRTTHEEDSGLTCCLDEPHSTHQVQLVKRIDYVFLFVSPGHDVQVLDCDLVLNEPFPSPRGWLWVSDHVGLMATLKID